MKRGLSTVLAALTFALMTGVGTASASDLLSPTGGQGNVSDQDQIQVVPIAPQINVQNANILTLDEVEQGNANNANTGQANQQSNTASGSSGGKAPGCDCGPSLADKPSGNQSNGQGQSNSSEQEQVQIVPIAPQANVQNVNVLTFDDVEQGDANNANTGQANQQSNTASGSRNSGKTSGGPSQTGRQGNFSEQEQIQFIPIAPQANFQNVNLLTFDDVSQGNANNANTGQANQQSNTATQHEQRGGPQLDAR